MKIKSEQIRQAFLDFFQEKDHLLLPAASVIPKDDPTLLFINSGMAPLKPYFLGKERSPKPRLCNVQPCIRTNDIEDVGDRHHLTFFEMLGSWSIGDYFKEQAVALAFELLVDRLRIPKQKLYVTVYQGNPSINIAPDEESAKAWQKVGIASDHIVFLGEDNFWGPAGQTGPCGPCTEVFFDTGSQFGPEYKPGKHFDDKGRYIEIWNAGVFMEFNKKADGSYEKLPLKSVDTGSGLERMTMTLNGFDSVYETDLMQPIMEIVANILDSKKSKNIAARDLRLITDHLKASSFIISGGVIPSNIGQGYIPRRLIRKCTAIAVKHSLKKVDFAPVIEVIIGIYQKHYPYIKSEESQIIAAINNEINDFMPTVTRGMEKLEKLANQNKVVISAQEAFHLVTTFGVPYDLIEDFVKQHNGSIEHGFDELFKEHQEISRKNKHADDSPHKARQRELIEDLAKSSKPTTFVGYEQTIVDSKVTKIIKGGRFVNELAQGDEAVIITEKTPFYAESGGQVGDTGTIISNTNKFIVTDTQKFDHLFVHYGIVEEGSFKEQMVVRLQVDTDKRQRTRLNHSATHLLHAALRKILGSHATQRGSYVDSERLRFDFDHPQKVNQETLEQIEDLVNQWIRTNYQANVRTLPYKQAIAEGALAMFSEKYSADVRVVKFGDTSMELCGGTHVGATGDIGIFLITSESSIAKGIRRIEAVTGEAALKVLRDKSHLLKDLCSSLNVTADLLPAKIITLKDQVQTRKTQKTVETANFLPKEQLIKSQNVILGRIDNISPAHLREETLKWTSRGPGNIVCLYGEHEGKALVSISVPKHLTTKVNAKNLLLEVLAVIDGKGGGKETFAQGGGTNLAKIEQIPLEFIRAVEDQLN